MGQTSSSLTQRDVEEIIEYCGGRVTQAEVESLYIRFKRLDRGRKGFLSRDEFLNIPEVSINPLCTRLTRFFSGVNFMEFSRILSVFSRRATAEDKLKFMFQVHDLDGDGVVSAEDLRLTIQMLAGSSLDDAEAHRAAELTIEQAGGEVSKGLNFQQYAEFMAATPLSMTTDFKVDPWSAAWH